MLFLTLLTPLRNSSGQVGLGRRILHGPARILIIIQISGISQHLCR